MRNAAKALMGGCGEWVAILPNGHREWYGLVSDAEIEANAAFIVALVNAYRTGQLVERDGVDGVDGVVMNHVLPIIDAAIGQAQIDERFDRVHCLTGVRKDVFAALTAIKGGDHAHG